MSRWHPLRVVVADDVADLRLLVRIVLEGSGEFEIVGEASTGRTAIDAAEQFQPDVILLDLSMPDMDGLEALPHIRERSPNSQVVVLTALTEPTIGSTVRALGACGYIDKRGAGTDLTDRLLDVIDLDAERPPRH